MTTIQKVRSFFDLASKICAVMVAPAIAISTAATVVLFPLVNVFSLAAGNWREKFNLIVRNPVAIMFLIFYGMFLVGIVYSTASWSDIFIVLRKYDKFLLGIMFFPLFAEERWRNYAINAFMIGISVLLLASYLRAIGWLHYGAKEVVEMFKHSIEFNFLMAFASYVCLLKITSSKKYRFMWVTFFIIIVHTILFRSVGRSGYFVFIGLMGLFFVQKFSWRGLILAIIGSTVLFGLAFNFSPTFNQRIKAIFSDAKGYSQTSNTSVGSRMEFVENSVKLVTLHPLLGTGTGSFVKEYAAGSTDALATRNPHNEYLHVMVQFGFVGLAILLFFFGVPLWYSKFLPENQKYIARGAIVGIMLGCFANSWLLDVTEGHFYAYFIALALAALPESIMRKNTSTPKVISAQ